MVVAKWKHLFLKGISRCFASVDIDFERDLSQKWTLGIPDEYLWYFRNGDNLSMWFPSSVPCPSGIRRLVQLNHALKDFDLKNYLLMEMYPCIVVQGFKSLQWRTEIHCQYFEVITGRVQFDVFVRTVYIDECCSIWYSSALWNKLEDGMINLQTTQVI